MNLSLRNKIWHYDPIEPTQNIIRTILGRRYNYDEQDINKFINPTFSSSIPDALSLKNVGELVQTILSANKIGMFIDYDVDGVTSGAIWHNLLSDIRKEYVVYCPSRSEGYGPSERAIDFFRNNNCDVILFLDCGTSADILRKVNNIKMCILDHHKPGSITVDNAIIVNPYLSEQREYYNICTAGLSFLVATVFNHFSIKTEYTRLLDLACLGTIADCMQLHGYNRAIVKYGLDKINGRPIKTRSDRIITRYPCTGIKVLMDLMNKHDINASTLGYYIVPCLNAAGRLDTSYTAFKLLVREKYDDAVELAQQLINLNSQRKIIEREMMVLAENQADESANITIVRDESWHPGITGIIAGRIKEKNNKTTFAFYKKDNAWHGSGRSAGHKLNHIINLGIEAGLVRSGGGHALAAGLCIDDHKFAEWQQWMQQHQIHEDNSTIVIDYEIKPGQKLPDIKDISPFGQGHESLRIMIQGLWLKNIITRGEYMLFTFANHPYSYYASKYILSWARDISKHVGRMIDIVLLHDDSNKPVINDIRIKKYGDI